MQPIIFLFITIIILAIAIATLLISFMILQQKPRRSIGSLLENLKKELQNAGFSTDDSSKKTELYRWIPMEDSCDEALERANWPAMDIVDWMKEGLPQTPEMKRKCGKDCNCQLVREDELSHFQDPFSS